MEKSKTIVLKLVPKFQELRDCRTYTEPQVKQILYGYARDLGDRRKRKTIMAEIDRIFDFD